MNTTLSIILPGVLIIVNIILIIIVVNMNKRNREEQRFLLQELQRLNRENREDVTLSLSRFSDSLNQNFSLMRDSSDKSMNMLGEIQKEKLDQIEKRQGELIINTEKKLEHIRATVEEKLEKTLSERLGRSFETVGKQLIEVQKGLGEMQVLAQDVGGLKRVLSNVKMRGGIGEVQLRCYWSKFLHRNNTNQM